MARNNTVELAVKLKDQASQGLAGVANQVKQTGTQIENQAKRSANTQQAEVRKTARVTEQSYRQMQQAMRTRQQLGIRSENAIQKEINQTIASYERLRRSGVLSARQLANEAQATKNKIAQLNAEMGKMSMGQRLGNIGRGVMGVGAGIAAGAMVMREPLVKQMSYDRALAMAANTAYADRDVAGRIAGKKELDAAVRNAVKVGGGTKEDALGTLETLFASGAVDPQTAIKLLPTLQKGATATGAGTEDLAKIAISAMQQFGIGEDQIGEVLDKAVAAGQAGNFELSDMARWLPQQMAAAKSAGLTGMSGLETLLIANQQARVTAGSSDEAGNNLVNFLAKLTAKETNDRFANLTIKGKDGKDHGVDFISSLEAQKAKGLNTIDAFMAIMDQVIGEDAKYKELQKKLKTAKGAEQAQLLDQMTDIVEGTAIGKIVSDRQALMALLGIRNNVNLGKEVADALNKSKGAVDKSHAVIADTNDYKVEQAKSTLEFAQMQGLSGLNNVIGDTSQKLTDYANEYPNLTAALAGAATGIAGLAAAATVAAGSLRLLGVSGGLGLGAGAAGAAVGGIGAAGKMGKVGKLSRLGGAGGALLKKAGWLGLGLTVADYMTPIATAQAARTEAENEKTAPQRQQFAAGYGRPLSEVGKPAEIKADPYADARAKFAQAYGGGSRTTTVNYAGAYAIADRMRNNEIAEERLAQGTLSQAAYQARVANNGQAIAAYQADYGRLGDSISNGLKAALASSDKIIQNQIKVDLDGRTIAEQVSEYQYNEFKRG